MANDRQEIPLHGGRLTKGVVRIGDTVRRPRAANTHLVRQLLQHLHDSGFKGAPIPLGTDEQEREIFSYIAGEVPADLAFHDDETLQHAALLIRRYHNLTTDLVTAGCEVICHNDLSPCNFVFRTGIPVAIIDFDAAEPGSRIHDLGYAAWLWLDLGSPEITAPEQARRLALFLDAYGMDDRKPVLAAILERQAILIAQGIKLKDAAMADWAASCREWTLNNVRLLSEP